MTVTVKESPITVFTPEELATVTDALRIANAHYRSLAELTSARYGTGTMRPVFEQQAQEASDLQLKIEAGR